MHLPLFKIYEWIFADMIDIIVIIYLDDISHLFDNISKHKLHIREVLRRLHTNKLFARADKCEFHVTSCEYLGYMLSPEGLTMAPYKVQIIQHWPIPRKVQGHSILPWLCQFLPSFHLQIFWNHSSTHTSYPQGYPLAFSDECHSAFEALKKKKAFTTVPVLTHWILDNSITVKTDTSDYALATVLSITTPMATCNLLHSTPRLFLPRNSIMMSMKRATRNFWSFQTMATLPQRLWTSNRCGHRSLEFAILFNYQNHHASTSPLVWIPFQIQSRNSFPSWKILEPNLMHSLDDGTST